MALGLSSIVWRQAVVAETWALSMLFFAIMLCLLMRWMFTPERGFLLGAIFVFGVLLTSNQEVILLVPTLLLWVMLGDQNLGRDLFLVSIVLSVIDWAPNWFGLSPWVFYYGFANLAFWLAFLLVGVAAVVIVVRTRRIGSQWKSACLCTLVLVLGLACSFYLPIASMTNPPSNWAYPRTVEGFFHSITRGQYERPHATDNLGRFIAQLGNMAKQAGGSFGWAYFPFIVLPFCCLRQAERRARNWLFGLAAIFVGAGPFLIATLNPTANSASLQLVGPYFGAMDVVLAVWIGLGLMVVAGLVGKRKGEGLKC